MVWCCNTSGPRTLPRASTGTDQQEGQKLVLWTFHFKNTLNGSTWCMSSFLGDTGSIQLLGFHGLPTRLTHTKISGQSAGTSCWAPHSKPKEARKGSLWRLPNLRPLGAGGGWFDRCVAVTSSQYPMDPHGIPYLGDLVPHLQSSIRWTNPPGECDRT